MAAALGRAPGAMARKGGSSLHPELHCTAHALFCFLQRRSTRRSAKSGGVLTAADEADCPTALAAAQAALAAAEARIAALEAELTAALEELDGSYAHLAETQYELWGHWEKVGAA